MRIAVVILNWNGWTDTLECLESLFRAEGIQGPIVVCDNDSQDDSLTRIRGWAEGREKVAIPNDHPLAHLSHPPVPKPIRYVEYDREKAERGGAPAEHDIPLVLVRTGANLGFAGGNNVGLGYALARPDVDAVWLLNNDTVVHPEAARALIEIMARDPGIGICGSTLLYYDRPELVQALGGARYNEWMALPAHIGDSTPAHEIPDPAEVVAQMAYVAGASMLVSRGFLEEVGLMEEGYFLYFEELDWARRAAGRFRLGYAPESIVYHKEGRSIGTQGAEQKSALADYYFVRNRLRVTRRHFPSRLPTVRMAILLALANRIRRRQWDRVRMILRLWREG